MKIDKEEEKFLLEVKYKVDKLINDLCEKYCFDRAFFNFVLKCDVLDSSFRKIEEVVLLDDTEYGFCTFCRKKTYFVEDDQFYCPECYSKLKKKQNKSNERIR